MPPRPERFAGTMENFVDRVLRYEPEGNVYLHMIVRADMAKLIARIKARKAKIEGVRSLALI